MRQRIKSNAFFMNILKKSLKLQTDGGPPRSILRTTKQTQEWSPHLTQSIFFAQKTAAIIHFYALQSAAHSTTLNYTIF